ncbi:MAG: hypothetical protein PHF00_12225 [Elusimicrobia bacterium]|nr:hypothetical protein [Elusimicrobiota bacterium]
MRARLSRLTAVVLSAGLALASLPSQVLAQRVLAARGAPVRAVAVPGAPSLSGVAVGTLNPSSSLVSPHGAPNLPPTAVPTLTGAVSLSAPAPAAGPAAEGEELAAAATPGQTQSPAEADPDAIGPAADLRSHETLRDLQARFVEGRTPEGWQAVSSTLDRLFDRSAQARDGSATPAAFGLAAAAGRGLLPHQDRERRLLPPAAQRLALPSAAARYRLGEKYHSLLSLAYTLALSFFALHRVVTDDARRAFYRQIAVASHHQHAWTLRELIDLGMLNDFISIPTAMALSYLMFVCIQAANRSESVWNKWATMAVHALGLTALCFLLFAYKPGHGLDFMNIIAYGLGGLTAAILNSVLWYPPYLRAGSLKGTSGKEVLKIFSTAMLAMVTLFMTLVVLNSCLPIHLWVQCCLLAGLLALPVAMILRELWRGPTSVATKQ